MRRQIINANIILPEGVLSGGVCCFERGVIDYVGTRPQEGAHTVCDAGGGWLLPGFIDIHCHGGRVQTFQLLRCAHVHIRYEVPRV